MKAKYIEEQYPRYIVFGQHENGLVDVASTECDTIATVTKEHAEQLIADRDAVIQLLCDMADAWDKADTESFKKFWYNR